MTQTPPTEEARPEARSLEHTPPLPGRLTISHKHLCEVAKLTFEIAMALGDSELAIGEARQLLERAAKVLDAYESRLPYL